LPPATKVCHQWQKSFTLSPKAIFKKELANAMQWDHPTRILDLGTLNANITRTLNNANDKAITKSSSFSNQSVAPKCRH
jgi:hypothetical protein